MSAGKRRSRYFHEKRSRYFEEPSTSTELATVATTDAASCPRCGSALARRDGRYGVFTGCTAFPRCRYTEPAPSGTALPARGSRAPATGSHRDGGRDDRPRLVQRGAAAQQEAARAALARLTPPPLHAEPRADRAASRPSAVLRSRSTTHSSRSCARCSTCERSRAGGHARLLPRRWRCRPPTPTPCRACRRALAARPALPTRGGGGLPATGAAARCSPTRWGWARRCRRCCVGALRAWPVPRRRRRSG